MSSTAETFTRIAADLDYPMFIVTTAADGQTAGCLVGFATQCSIDPARFLVCVSERNHTYRVAARARILAVHVIGADQLELARLFGAQTEDDIDKFARCRWRPGPDGVPVLEDCERWFAGEILERHRLGDHVGFLLDPVAGAHHGPGGLLWFQQVKDLEPGHLP